METFDRAAQEYRASKKSSPPCVIWTLNQYLFNKPVIGGR